MPDIAQALAGARELASDSARLDVELLLCQVLACSRTYLYTWPERTLSDDQWQAFRALLARRAAGEPVAYILGQREFWSLPLAVSTATLIPRPATETLVALVLRECPGDDLRVLDLGTGTGAIALALASERPGWQLTGVDYSPAAVALAQHNRQQLGCHNCRFLRSDWFGALVGQRFDAIVANPPYIDAADPHLQQGDVRFEPHSALVASEQGLADLRHIADTAPQFLRPGGLLALEHGCAQAEAVQQLLRAAGFTAGHTDADLEQLPRATWGRWP